MSFKFNFLPNSSGESVPIYHSPEALPEAEEKTTKKASNFRWVPDVESRFLERLEKLPPHDRVPLVDAVGSVIQSDHEIRRVLDEASAAKFRGTDLIPGVYEGGGVVWECSLDLCRYLQENEIKIQGDVLELGCGHGLPGCWVLRQARKAKTDTTRVVFSDFNEFVLNATISNIALNTSAMLQDGQENITELCHWLTRCTALGAGDWHAMSQSLLTDDNSSFPPAVPSNGKFDYILAAETTYSPSAAEDTAALIVKHLNPRNGVAYIATKRYYFGVGGGSESFIRNLQNLSSTYKYEILMEYDNGAGNIRELIRVTTANESAEDTDKP